MTELALMSNDLYTMLAPICIRRNMCVHSIWQPFPLQKKVYIVLVAALRAVVTSLFNGVHEAVGSPWVAAVHTMESTGPIFAPVLTRERPYFIHRCPLDGGPCASGSVEAT